jgi:hypothetical protein
MNEIVQMVSQKFNIAPETAQQIVTFIAEQVKGKLPEGLSQHMDAFMAGGTAAGVESGGGILDAVKGMASNLMGKA